MKNVESVEKSKYRSEHNPTKPTSSLSPLTAYWHPRVERTRSRSAEKFDNTSGCPLKQTRGVTTIYFLRGLAVATAVLTVSRPYHTHHALAIIVEHTSSSFSMSESHNPMRNSQSVSVRRRRLCAGGAAIKRRAIHQRHALVVRDPMLGRVLVDVRLLHVSLQHIDFAAAARPCVSVVVDHCRHPTLVQRMNGACIPVVISSFIVRVLCLRMPKGVAAASGEGKRTIEGRVVATIRVRSALVRRSS